MMTSGVSFLASLANRVSFNTAPKVRRFYCRVTVHSIWL
jgi:hypothetical protein